MHRDAERVTQLMEYYEGLDVDEYREREAKFNEEDMKTLPQRTAEELLESDLAIESAAPVGYQLYVANGSKKCMDVTTTDWGSKVVILYKCDKTRQKANQRWYFVGDQIHTAHEGGGCLTVKGDRVHAQATIEECDSTRTDQTWYMSAGVIRTDAAPEDEAAEGAEKKLGGLCLDSKTNYFGNDKLILYPCHGKKNQQFSVHRRAGPAPAYDAAEVKKCGYLMSAAYCTPEVIQEGDAGAPGGLSGQGLTLVKFIHDPETDVDAFIAKPSDDDKSKPVVVGVRGTMGTTDIKKDLTFFMVEPATEAGDRFAHADGAKVHLGFRSQWRAMRPQMYEELDKLVAAGYTSVLVTGHSLGGAVATIVAMDLHYNLKSGESTFLEAGGDIRLYSFGSPRVANDELTAEFNTVVRKSWRVVNNLDPIPCLPQKFLGFDHVNSVLFRNEKAGKWEYDIDGQETCPASFLKWKVMEHMPLPYIEALKHLE